MTDTAWVMVVSFVAMFTIAIIVTVAVQTEMHCRVTHQLQQIREQMTFWDDIGQAIQALIAQTRLPAANTHRLTKAVRDLQHLIPPHERKHVMSTPNPMVQVAQADLDKFASDLEAVKSALSEYITKLVAGQGTPLAAADETGLNKALTDLTSLEPPTPAPPTP